MSPSSTTNRKKIGGEYGDIRGPGLDEAKLNEYLKAHAKSIRTPVDIKQFKVSYQFSVQELELTLCQFGQVRD